MPEELDQKEMDVNGQGSRGRGGAETGLQELKLERWDARRAGQIGRDQLQALTQIHEGFARSLTESLGAYLRVAVAAVLVSVEHSPFREFLKRIPETTYLASCRLEPMGVNGVLQLDLKVAFPIVDLLLGGEGKSVTAAREITEIEEQIVESVARVVCLGLVTAWQAIDLQVDFDKRMGLEDAQRLTAPEEKMLSLSFEITMLEVRGGLNVAVPVSVSHALLRKISAELMDRRPQGHTESRERLKHRLLECPFSAELVVNDLRAAVSELAQLTQGQLLPLRRSAAQPASMLVGGIEMFSASPARCGETRGAQLLDAMVEAEATFSEVKYKETKNS
jgi:flagellar motor switch protein FliM